jgi:Ca2+-binding RTX toxin-like protein
MHAHVVVLLAGLTSPFLALVSSAEPTMEPAMQPVTRPATQRATASCDGHRATIVGTPGDDVIDGTGHADVIAGLGGSDIVRGRGGDDRICGGNGAARLYGGRGSDVVIALLATQPGAVYDGGPGADSLRLSSFVVNGGGLPSTGTWHLGSGALRFAGPVSATATAVRFEDADLSTVGTSWEVTGTPVSEQLDARATSGTTFRALAGDDGFRGSPSVDVFDGGDGTDRSPGTGGGSDFCLSVEQPAGCESVTP